MMHVAIVGCGQLARMLALAGWPMGMKFSFVAEENEPDDCVRGLGRVVRRHEAMQAADLYRALGSPQVITVEKEQVDVDLLKALQAFCPVHPDPEIIRVCQHRGREKDFLRARGIETAPYEYIHSIDELPQVMDSLGLPLIVKSCEQGYDGQNQWRVESRQAGLDLMQRMQHSPGFVVEAMVDFTREISLLLVRSANGSLDRYPVTENRHRNGILLTSIAPAEGLTPPLLYQCDQISERIMHDWNYVGVLAIECFVYADRVLVNELAPRVHNSGHWTQQGATTSQFENHLRAICGFPPGSTSMHAHAAMLNLIGRDVDGSFSVEPDSYLHRYNKSVRPGRKLGHINLLAHDPAQLRRRLHDLLCRVYDEPETRRASTIRQSQTA